MPRTLRRAQLLILVVFGLLAAYQVQQVSAQETECEDYWRACRPDNSQDPTGFGVETSESGAIIDAEEVGTTPSIPMVDFDFDQMAVGATTSKAVIETFPGSVCAEVAVDARAGTGTYGFQVNGKGLSSFPGGPENLGGIATGDTFQNIDRMVWNMSEPIAEFCFQVGDWSGPFNINFRDGGGPGSGTELGTLVDRMTVDTAGAPVHCVRSSRLADQVELSALPQFGAANWVISLVQCPVATRGAVNPVDGHYAAIRDQWIANGGGTPLQEPGETVQGLNLPNTPGTLWDNGPTNGVNGLASERNTFTTGSDGPEGDWIAAVAVDFEVPGLAAGSGNFLLEEFRTCMYHTGTVAEIYGYVDVGQEPDDETNPLFGAPTTDDFASDVFEDNGQRCQGAFGFPGRQYQFNADTTGAAMPTVPEGTYWIASVGEGGTRGFWADSDGPDNPGNTVQDKWGSTTFGAPYWSDTSIQGQPHFAMDIDGAQAGAATGPGVDPNRQLGGQVHLPILNFQGQDDVCRTWIEVQYIGCDPSKAVLVTWGEPGFCPPQAAGPLKVECTGLLNPGSTWNLLGAQIPTGSKSGILFKFTAQQLSDVGLDDDLGFDDVVADLMCETLFFGVVGDSDDYRRFKKAYNEGLDFAGINQRIAAGAGVLAVEVLRHCPGDVTPGVEVSSRYNGIAGTHLGIYDPIFGGHGYYVPLIYAEKAGLNTVMYIQNGGLECSSVEIWFKAQDDCLRARICEIFTLAPGESYQWDASDCVGPDWQGSAWLRSSQVMGIAVDIFGRDILMTYIGEPQPFAYVVTGDDGEPEVVETLTTGEKIAYGPLMYSEYQGWDTGVQVQNLSEVVNAKVKVYFLDRSGDVITTLVDWICPRGSQTYFLPVVADLPGSWVGSIRIESQDWWTPGTNPVDAPNIAGVATLMKYSDVARTDTQEAIAYNLLPEHKSYIWQIGSGAGGTFSGVGLIAIPSLLKDLDNTGTTSEVAIMNLVAKPGFTDFAIYIYDQNGLLDFVCQKLHSRQVEYIDLQTWGYVNNGFKGSAIISATFWEHDVFGPTGEFVRNLVGLGAVGIERTGTRLGEDVPGDEAAGSRGIPFEVDRNIGLCLGGFLPRCPGQPILQTITEEVSFSASNTLGEGTGGLEFTSAGATDTVTVNAPAGCRVTDVNLDLEITTNFMGDNVVMLGHGGVMDTMFANQCSLTSGTPWLATLDDDAADPFTTACTSPLTNGTFQTQSGSALDTFDGSNAAGDWTITASNPFTGEAWLNSWGVNGLCESTRQVLVTPE